MINSADEDYPVLMAQARFLRAHFNMQLLLKFGNVPNITPENAAALEYNLPNSGETQLTWADIESDFQFAVANLPSSRSGSYSEPGRPLSHGAKAYLGKAYLYQGKWADASSSLDAVISSGAYSLNPEYVENFKSSGENSSESVFAIQFAADGGVSNQGNKGGTLNFPAGGPIGSCCGFYQPTQDLVDAFQTDANGLPLLDTYQSTHVANDYHVASADPFTLHTGNLDPRLDYTAGRRGIDYNGWGPAAGKDWIRASFDDISGPYLSKKNMYHAGDDANRGTGGWGEQRSGINYHFMRYSDVLLMAAEAAVEAGFYGYGRQQGESHEQARENLFFPKIAAKLAPKVWEGLGLKPFKTGITEGPEGLIEKELIGTRWDPSGKVNRGAEYADGMKALEDEYANASKIDFELGLLKNQWQPGSEEEIEAKEQELRDSYGRIEELQINIKEGTPKHEAYVAAQEKQKALRDKRAQDYYGDSPAYKGSKQRQWQEEFLDYRGADRKYRKEQPFAFKGGIEANIGPTKEESEKGMRIPWEEYFPRTIDTPRTTEQQKWDYIMNQGGGDLTDKISAAGGVANMAGGGIAGIRRPWAIPPESGPDPYGGGLSSQFNRVKKLTE